MPRDIHLSGFTKQVAAQLRRDPVEVEGLWRRAKKHCKDSLKGKDYLLAASMLATALLLPKEKVRMIPQEGDTLIVQGVGRVRVLRATSSMCVGESEKGDKVMLPLASFFTLS